MRCRHLSSPIEHTLPPPISSSGGSEGSSLITPHWVEPSASVFLSSRLSCYTSPRTVPAPAMDVPAYRRRVINITHRGVLGHADFSVRKGTATPPTVSFQVRVVQPDTAIAHSKGAYVFPCFEKLDIYCRALYQTAIETLWQNGRTAGICHTGDWHRCASGPHATLLVVSLQAVFVKSYILWQKTCPACPLIGKAADLQHHSSTCECILFCIGQDTTSGYSVDTVDNCRG